MDRIRLFLTPVWWHRVNRHSFRADIIAGLTNATIVLPQGVAFATVAGLPPQYGLYTAMVTAVIAAFFGSSMVMISGPTTAISALVFISLADLATPGSARYIELAILLTLLVGLFQLIAGLARLGGLVSFVSHSVIVAFTAAAALLIAVSQMPGATGIVTEGGGNVIERIGAIVSSWDQVNAVALAIAAASLGTAILIQWLAPRLPAFLMALAGGAIAGILLDAPAHGVAMLGALPAALPAFDAPRLSWTDIGTLASAAAAVALVGLLEAMSIGRSFAVRRREPFAANREIVAQGMSNAVGSFFQCYAGSGSFTRSSVNAESGAQTPMAAITASLFLAAILLLFSSYITVIPQPAIAGLILYVAWRLIDRKEIAHIIRTSRPETLILLLTLGAGLLLDLDTSIYVGVIASFSIFIFGSARPSLRVSAPVLSPSGRRKFRNADMHGVPECPQLLTVRLDGPLYFGSFDHVEAEWKRLRARRPGQKHIIFYLKGVGRIDLWGADFLIQASREVREVGGSFHIVALFPPLLESLRRFHVIDEIGEDRLYASKGDALTAVIPMLDMGICAGCTRRIFTECADLPGAECHPRTAARLLTVHEGAA